MEECTSGYDEMIKHKHIAEWPRLRELHAEGLSLSEVAKRLGKGWTRNMVVRQFRVMHLESKNSPSQPGMTSWTDEDIAKLRSARAICTTWGPISIAVGRSIEACYDKCKSLGHMGQPVIGPPIIHGGRKNYPKKGAQAATATNLLRQSVAITFAAERRSAVTTAPEKRGTPGVWQMPVAKQWGEIVHISHGAVRTRDDLVLFNRSRVRNGYAPLAVAR
jgi:hypothetical protein